MTWEPPLTPKQRELYWEKRRIIGCLGARLSGKTRGIEHLVMKHAWRHKARIACVLNTTRTGTEGVWPHLTEVVYKQWYEAGVGSDQADFRWSTRPTRDAFTKLHYAELFNRHGTVSRMVLFPVKRAEDALDKLLSTEWSMIWISEAHLYTTDRLFKTALLQLRVDEVPFGEMKIICDANPPEEGKSHWFYEPFMHDVELARENWPLLWTPEECEAFERRQEQTALYRFRLADNTFLDDSRRKDLIATYLRNREEYRRLVDGDDAEGGEALYFFRHLFFKDVHVVGEGDNVLSPSQGPHVEREFGRPLLVSGWDPGEVNFAWVALQPWINEQGQECYDVLEEEVHVGERLSLEGFTEMVLAKMKDVEALADFIPTWTHYSDSSAHQFRFRAKFGRDVPDEDLADAAVIQLVSRGRINLIGAKKLKNPGWQARRVHLIQELLRQGRIRISHHCHWVIRMLGKLKKNTVPTAKAYIAMGQDEKHIFDALSYAIGMRLIGELAMGHEALFKERPQKAGLISV